MIYIHSLNRYFITIVITMMAAAVFLTGCYLGPSAVQGPKPEIDEEEGLSVEEKASLPKAKEDETSQQLNTMREDLRSFFNYKDIVTEKIANIQDRSYRDSFYNNKSTSLLRAIDHFNSYGYADRLLENKVDIDSIIGLFEILKDQEIIFSKKYLESALYQGSNSISLIVSSNYYDFDTGLSAYISDKYNIPYFIISYKDGSYRGGRTGFKNDLDELDERWKKEGIYMEIAPFIGELNFAKKYGGYSNIHFDKTKKEILAYLRELLEEYDTVYYFSNVHGQSMHNNKLLIYSSSGLEYFYPEDIYSIIKEFEDPKRFVFIGHHCYSNFEKDLAGLLEGLDNIDYLLLSASDGKSVETNMLQAINYASDGILTIDELEDISDGVGSIASETLQHELGERKICYFATDIPGYIMELECEGVGDLDIKMYTNTEPASIFYYDVGFFNQDPG